MKGNWSQTYDQVADADIHSEIIVLCCEYGSASGTINDNQLSFKSNSSLNSVCEKVQQCLFF